VKLDPRGKWRFRRGAVALVTLLLLGSAPPSSARLVGVWESVERSEGGVGMTYEFRPDGTVCVAPGAMVDFVYRFVDGKVLVLNADLSENPETVMAFRLENDQLVVDSGNAAPPLERVEPADPEEGPVVGIWKYVETGESEKAMGGAEAAMMRHNTRIRLTPDGKVQLRIPFRVDCSPYQIEGSTLTMERSGKAITPEFRIENDLLILISRSGSEATFRLLAP